MSTSIQLSHGLQEWAVTCRALADGRMTLLVRKGGIHERGGGLFSLTHQQFALLPTYLHQQAERLHANYAGEYFARVAADPQPGSIVIKTWASAVHIWQVSDLLRVQSLGTELMWSAEELATRFAYRDQPWLYVVALRVYRLPQPLIIADHPSYAGCRSWIPLQSSITTAESQPVIDDVTHAKRLAAITAQLNQSTPGLLS
jgi:hypothetical protein